MSAQKKHDSFSIRKLLELEKTKKLNLNPGFQRSSVWSQKDRRLLIDTIFKGMPLPSIFLWERTEGKKKIYDVLDGKQRIESLLEFTKIREPLSVKFDPEGDEDWKWQESYEWTWKELQKEEKKIASRFLKYEFPVVIVQGNLPDIEQIFIRINSTGKVLTRQEINHAKWYGKSDLLSTAELIAKKYKRYFLEMGILSQTQMTRMKAVELITELMLSIEKGDVLDRKKALDSVMGNRVINKNTVQRLGREVKAVLGDIKSAFPELKTTRFSKVSDFYALSFVVWEMKRDGYILKGGQAAGLAFFVLNQLGLELSKYSQSFRAAEPHSLKSPAREYHSTVSAGTDTAKNRRERARIIKNILAPIFGQKDSKRFFTLEQKQLLWHSSKEKCCHICKKNLIWDDVQMDHIKPYTKGGRANLKNAQMLCVSCNSRKGGR